MLTLVAFFVALGVLIAVHEYGHYRVAVACGVKVLRFSVGFGKPLLRWQPQGSSTEFVLGAFPLGGYVRMLDEREAPVPPAERHRAFNTQPLRSRALIVAAGPVANLVLAVLLYALVNWLGVQEPMAYLARPVPGSVAQQAGLQGHEFLHVLDAEHGLGVAGGLVQGGARGGQVQLDELFHAFKGLGRQAKQGFDVGLVGGEDLFGGQGHVVSPWQGGGVPRVAERLPCPGLSAMLQCSMNVL